MFVKGIPLDELRRKYKEGENTGKRERKLSLVVDTEVTNKEEESKMKYKMQHLDELKFRADALIQTGLGELFWGSITTLFPFSGSIKALLSFELMLLFRQA